MVKFDKKKAKIGKIWKNLTKNKQKYAKYGKI